MSYCRWSSDHFECDVYVYAHVDGFWSTNVAGRRRKTPLPDHIKAMYSDIGDKDWPSKYMAAEAATQAFIESQPCDEREWNVLQKDGSVKKEKRLELKDSEYIDLSTIGEEAGQSYDDATPGECADRLERLKAKGFNVPQYAINNLRQEEIESRDNGILFSGPAKDNLL